MIAERGSMWWIVWCCERYEPNRAVARRLVTEHNHTKHKEAT